MGGLENSQNSVVDSKDIHESSEVSSEKKEKMEKVDSKKVAAEVKKSGIEVKKPLTAQEKAEISQQIIATATSYFESHVDAQKDIQVLQDVVKKANMIDPNKFREGQYTMRQVETYMKIKMKESLKVMDADYKSYATSLKVPSLVEAAKYKDDPAYFHDATGKLRLDSVTTMENKEVSTLVDGTSTVPVSFQEGVSTLDQNAQNSLQSQLNAIRNDPTIDQSTLSIHITANASNLGSKTDNQNLADARAQKAQAYLNNFNVPIVVEKGVVSGPSERSVSKVMLDNAALAFANEGVVSPSAADLKDRAIQDNYRPHQRVDVTFSYKKKESHQEQVPKTEYKLYKKNELLNNREKMITATTGKFILSKDVVHQILSNPDSVNKLISTLPERHQDTLKNLLTQVSKGGPSGEGLVFTIDTGNTDNRSGKIWDVAPVSGITLHNYQEKMAQGTNSLYLYNENVVDRNNPGVAESQVPIHQMSTIQEFEDVVKSFVVPQDPTDKQVKKSLSRYFPNLG